ncbi:MAG: septum formation initiator family protein [Oscillospiraceae bacterium]|jgi:cell division protein FtsB|nr:septum formation initiator family protein [Oscillospiraceae bacterium]
MKRAKPAKKGRLLKLVILIFALWSAMTLVSLQGQTNQKKAEKDVLETQLAAQRLRNAALLESIESDSVIREIYAQIARDKLGLYSPDEIIIINRTP